MNKRDTLIEKIKGMSDEKTSEFGLFLQEQFNCTLQAVDSWKISKSRNEERLLLVKSSYFT